MVEDDSFPIDNLRCVQIMEVFHLLPGSPPLPQKDVLNFQSTYFYTNGWSQDCGDQ